MALTASGSKARQNPGLATSRQPCLVEGSSHESRGVENEKRALLEDKPYKTLQVQGQKSQRINNSMSLQREVRQTNRAKDSLLLESSPPVHRVCDVDKGLRSYLKPSTAAKQPNMSTKTNKQPKTESPSTSTLPSSSSSKPSQHRGRDRKRRRAKQKGQETSWVYVNAVEDFSNPTRRDQLLKGFQSSSSDEDVIVPTPIVSRVVPDVVHPLPSSSQSKGKPLESSPPVSHIDESLLKSNADSTAYDSSPSSLPTSSSTTKTAVTSSSLPPPPSRQLGRMGSEVTTSNNYRPHLHALHRIRRERKRGLALDEDNFMNQTTRPRPSIVDRKEMFHRFGEKEKEALSAFNFLDELYVSSCPSSPIKGLLDEPFPYTFTESPEHSPFKSYTWSKWTTRQRTRSRSRSSNRFSGDSFESPVLSPRERKLSLSALPSCYSVSTNQESKKEQQFQKHPSNQTSNDNIPFIVENTFQTDTKMNHHVICNNRRRLKDFTRCRSHEDEENTCNHDSTTSEENLTWPLTWPSLSHDDTCTQWTHRKSLVLSIDQDDNVTDDNDHLCSNHRDHFVSDEEGNDGREVHSPDTKLEVSQLLHALEQLSFDDSSNSEGNVLEQRETDIM